ncbi:MAG TPA: TraX family protein [Bacillota bacterium]|nr:TraX family protein [Bacillota bacterium]
MIFTDKEKKGINSFALRTTAIAAMLCDFVWTYLVPGQNWVMKLEWFAFPLFAFLLSEGFRHSSNRPLYATRLVIFACLSEIPYNLMTAKALSFPRSQNVMMTLCLGLACMSLTHAARKKFGNVIVTGATAVLSTLGASALASGLGFEMGRCGIVIIMIFYIASGLKYAKLAQLAALAAFTAATASDHIVSPIIGEYRYVAPAQALSLLALILIWLYNGERGPNNLHLKRIFYFIYPLSCLAIYFLGQKY